MLGRRWKGALSWVGLRCVELINFHGGKRRVRDLRETNGQVAGAHAIGLGMFLDAVEVLKGGVGGQRRYSVEERLEVNPNASPCVFFATKLS